jgi:hypothetical protein
MASQRDELNAYAFAKRHAPAAPSAPDAADPPASLTSPASPASARPRTRSQTPS